MWRYQCRTIAFIWSISNYFNIRLLLPSYKRFYTFSNSHTRKNSFWFGESQSSITAKCNPTLTLVSLSFSIAFYTTNISRHLMGWQHIILISFSPRVKIALLEAKKLQKSLVFPFSSGKHHGVSSRLFNLTVPLELLIIFIKQCNWANAFFFNYSNLYLHM